MGFPGGAVVKNLPANTGDARDAGFLSLGREDPLEGKKKKKNTIYSSASNFIFLQSYFEIVF